MEKLKIFVIMPFSDENFEVYENLKCEFGDRFEFSNANDEGNQQNILQDVIQPIYNSNIIIADLTGLNPNVMYELGLAHSFNKKTIIITQDDINTLPFDLKQYRAQNYSLHFKKFADLISYLKRNLNGAIDGSVSFSNPVKDFLSINQISAVEWFNDTNHKQSETYDDKGFLDFLADIESDSEQLCASITEIGEDIKEMGNGINRGAVEINKVNKNGGNGNAAFIRKEVNKVSHTIDIFSSKLRKHNEKNAELWDKIENNSLGLLENPYAQNDENQEGLKKYIESLKSLKDSTTESRQSVTELKNIMNSVVGLQRSLTQSLRFVTQDLDIFIAFIDNLNPSIAKIINKSRFVIKN